MLENIIGAVAKVIMQSANDELLPDLKRDSQILDRIRTSFGKVLVKHKLPIWSFHEELPMKYIGKQVYFACLLNIMT